MVKQVHFLSSKSIHMYNRHYSQRMASNRIRHHLDLFAVKISDSGLQEESGVLPHESHKILWRTETCSGLPPAHDPLFGPVVFTSGWNIRTTSEWYVSNSIHSRLVRFAANEPNPSLYHGLGVQLHESHENNMIYNVML